MNKKSFIKVKVDSIQKIKECYKIYHHLNNTYLVIAFTLEDLKNYENNS